MEYLSIFDFFHQVGLFVGFFVVFVVAVVNGIDALISLSDF